MTIYKNGELIMKDNKQDILNAISKSLDDDNSRFWGFTTKVAGEIGDTNEFSSFDKSDIDVVNAVLIGNILQNILIKNDIEDLIDFDDSDFEYFFSNIYTEARKIMVKKLREIGKQANNEGPVNFMTVGKNSQRGMIAVDISDPETLKNNKKFKTMPKELQNMILKQAKETKNNDK